MSENGDRLDTVIRQVFERMRKKSPKPESCPDDQLLAAYHESGLTEEETERIEAHLVVCERCTEKIVLLSEMESSHRSAQGLSATREMVQKAKDLVQISPAEASLRDRFFEWLSAFRPVPAFAAACAALLILIFSIYTLYTPGDRDGMKNGLIRLAIISGGPSGGITRGTTRSERETQLPEGGVLRSGDRFRITFELQEGAYAYLLALNSQGHLARIFPGKDTSSVFKAEAGMTYFVPQDKGWFQLDDKTGIERIYLLVSEKPIGKIDQKVEELKKSGIDKIAGIFPGVKIQPFSFRHE